MGSRLTDEQTKLIANSLSKVAANLEQWADIVDQVDAATSRQHARLMREVDDIEAALDQLRENIDALRL